MRILKNKIARASKLPSTSSSEKASTLFESDEQILLTSKRPIPPKPITENNAHPKRKSQKRNSDARRHKLANKNIIKNFGRAIANFAASDIAFPYLEPLLKEKNVNWKDFVHYALSMRDFIQNIETFRDSMLRNEYEPKEKEDYKEFFRMAAEIFMKYFSVNWVFTGKMLYKMEYLKIRGALLRRIKNPSSFINLKSKRK